MTALRPEYTELLAKELSKQSLNIYGESGQGQWRLLEDLQDLLSKENKLVFLLSACFKSVKDVGNYTFCPDEKEAKPKS
jgi:hypothetical protein